MKLSENLCKGIRVLKSVKFLLLESELLGFGIWNPSSTDKESGILSFGSRIQNCLGFSFMGDDCIFLRDGK